MRLSRSRCLILSLILICGLVPECTADAEEASDGLSATREPIWLTDIPATEELINAAEVAVIGFFQDLEAPIVSVFSSMAQQFQDVSFGMSNSSEVLSHYNVTRNSICLFRMIAAGLFNAMVRTHLLLIMNKASAEYEDSMQTYRKAAKLFQGKVLFVLVDSGKRENGKVISYFQLKESQLPALAIYETENDKWDTLPITEVTVEKVRDFCDGFLKGTLLKNHTAEEDARKEEL
ncbi:endoplasmic reticulum resident protein 27 isoform X2 [Microtus pennsylvanicus]|uniref:endoplasmic reticulum resident protein 27 isoform X2 n=1 Tax=Microtus pennsylvanicus TaxID=10058 RepID=UPI003F6A6563